MLDYFTATHFTETPGVTEPFWGPHQLNLWPSAFTMLTFLYPLISDSSCCILPHSVDCVLFNLEPCYVSSTLLSMWDFLPKCSMDSLWDHFQECFLLFLIDLAPFTLQCILLICSVGFQYFSYLPQREDCRVLPFALDIDRGPGEVPFLDSCHLIEQLGSIPHCQPSIESRFCMMDSFCWPCVVCWLSFIKTV